MTEPRIAGTRPAVIELEAGSYWWCACGESKNQPWCDGSHKGTAFTPMKTDIAEARRVSMCTCKRSGNGPFCDGAHKSL